MRTPGCVVGLDIGSTTTKAVVVDRSRTILGEIVLTTGGYFEDRAESALSGALAQAGADMSQVEWVTATGYGRLRAPQATQTVTELSCHARGAFYHVPRCMTVVDIGGQDNKILSVDARGRRGRTKMNRKCAAGTGAFIENAAKQLGVACAELQQVASQATDVVEIGSFCTVFAANEIIEQLRRGSRKEAIARGVMRAVALRVFEMGRFAGEVVLTGGVAQYFPIVAEELQQLSGCVVIIPPSPQSAGALGAALYALDSLQRVERGETPPSGEEEDGAGDTDNPPSGKLDTICRGKPTCM